MVFHIYNSVQKIKSSRYIYMQNYIVYALKLQHTVLCMINIICVQKYKSIFMLITLKVYCDL